MFLQAEGCKGDMTGIQTGALAILLPFGTPAGGSMQKTAYEKSRESDLRGYNLGIASCKERSEYRLGAVPKKKQKTQNNFTTSYEKINKTNNNQNDT